MSKNIPTSGELNARIAIRQWSDSPNAAFGLDSNYGAPLLRWARKRSAGAMVHYGSKQTGDAVTHFFDLRRGQGTKPEDFTTSVVIEHAGHRYRVLRAADMNGAELFTTVECTQIGVIT
jgi:hypothetical protein